MPDTVEPPVERMTIAEAAHFLEVTPDTLRRAIKRGKVKTTRRSSDRAHLVDIDTTRVQEARMSLGLPRHLAVSGENTAGGELLRQICAEIALLREQLSAMGQRLEDQVDRAHREAEHARRDAEQACREREQDRERHRGAELAWMNERRAQLGRIAQLEHELERRRGLITRLFGRRP